MKLCVILFFLTRSWSNWLSFEQQQTNFSHRRVFFFCTNPLYWLYLPPLYLHCSNFNTKRTRRALRSTTTPWKEPRGSAPWWKFWIRRTMSVTSEFLRWFRAKIWCRVDVRLTTNDHTNIRMQINSSRFAWHKSVIIQNIN